jgi:hypothetical protein
MGLFPPQYQYSLGYCNKGSCPDSMICLHYPLNTLTSIKDLVNGDDLTCCQFCVSRHYLCDICREHYKLSDSQLLISKTQYNGTCIFCAHHKDAIVNAFKSAFILTDIQLIILRYLNPHTL